MPRRRQSSQTKSTTLAGVPIAGEPASSSLGRVLDRRRRVPGEHGVLGGADPLYVVSQRRDHFSTIMVTVVFAVYAVGVIVSLFLGGHISDWVGRKTCSYRPCWSMWSAHSCSSWPRRLPGLLVARIISGISVGLTTATATAYLAELHLGSAAGRTAKGTRRAQLVAIATNLGGIGVGPLIAGLLAQHAPQPLRLPYLVFADRPRRSRPRRRVVT